MCLNYVGRSDKDLQVRVAFLLDTLNQKTLDIIPPAHNLKP
jgi:hypothetical protein